MSDAASPVEVEITWPLRKKGVRLRARPRFICPPGASGTLQTRAGQTPLRGLVRDLSRAGLGVLLRQPLPPQTPVLIKLRDSQGNPVRELPATVAHVTPQAAGEWLVGCAFGGELTEAELQALLSHPDRKAGKEHRNGHGGRNHELN